MSNLKLISDERLVAQNVRFTGRHAFVRHLKFGDSVRPVYEAEVEYPKGYDDDAPWAGQTVTLTGFVRDGKFVPTS